MKRILLTVLVLGSCVLTLKAAPFYVLVNDSIYYLATATGQEDFQGRTQYAATCISLQAGDVVKCYDQSTSTAWAITVNDAGSYTDPTTGKTTTWGAPGFTATATGLNCTIAGNYDIYIKMKYEDDCWYIEGPQTGCTPAEPSDPGENPDPTPTGYSAAPAESPYVMLQGFYWDSYQVGGRGFGRTKWIDYLNKGWGSEVGKWFDLIWLPPCTASSGGLGYHPTNYSSLDGAMGTEVKFRPLVDTLHLYGARVVADIVVNHCDGASSWCKFNKLDFGTYGKFAPMASWICSTDEMNNSASEVTAECLGKATGAADDGYGSEANYAASRDWDHQNDTVRSMIKAYLKWLRYNVGIDGFRYDYCKGFHMSHVNDYNNAALPHFSVLEYWDGDQGVLQSRLSDAGWNTLTFDFATYYTALKNGIAAGYYSAARGAGLLGAGKSRYACTFVDSHDTFQRAKDGQYDVTGCGDSTDIYDSRKEKILMCNAYILSMPGIPCVFWPHWVAYKDTIKAMINARYKTGVHSESSVSDEAGDGYYKATITGTNGTIRLLLGPNSGYASTPSGYTKAISGNGWGVYYKLNSARADKDKNRTPVTKDSDPTPTALDETQQNHAESQIFLHDGQLYIRVADRTYDIQGRLVHE